jgi:hypothetical protein
MAGDRHRFVTLTLHSTTEPLVDLLKHLYQSFRRLRQTKEWCREVRGGAAILETKYCEETERWHAHLHIITHGNFFPQKRLSKLWLQATGTSHIVYIEAIPSVDTVVHYVTKYASKGWDQSYIRRPEQLDEAIVALRGVRSVICFGDWRHIKLTAPKLDVIWERVETLQNILWERVRDQTAYQDVWDSFTPATRAWLTTWTFAHPPPTVDLLPARATASPQLRFHM